MDRKTRHNLVIGKELTSEMKEYIDAFKYKFKHMFGVIPYVSITSKNLYVGEISMRELLQITNKALEESCPTTFSDGILSKSRLKIVVMYRQAFCKVASSLGYGCTAVGRFIDKNHATVVYSVRQVDNLLATNDLDMNTCLDNIYTKIENHIINHEETV